MDGALAYLEVLHERDGAERIDRYGHSLQAATMAFRDGEDEEMVVAALLHDIAATPSRRTTTRQPWGGTHQGVTPAALDSVETEKTRCAIAGRRSAPF